MWGIGILTFTWETSGLGEGTHPQSAPRKQGVRISCLQTGCEICTPDHNPHQLFHNAAFVQQTQLLKDFSKIILQDTCF